VANAGLRQEGRRIGPAAGITTIEPFANAGTGQALALVSTARSERSA
jgi:hypothetical protein